MFGVLWVVKINKIGFWDTGCYIFWDPWWECSKSISGDKIWHHPRTRHDSTWD